jgi:hypothetical protein
VGPRIREAMTRQMGWSAGDDPDLTELQVTLAADDPLRFLQALVDQVP